MSDLRRFAHEHDSKRMVGEESGVSDPGPFELVIGDVDGTLLTSDKRLTPATREAAHRLHEADINLMVTSGRPPRGLAMLIEPLQLTTPLAAFNGGMFVSPQLEVLQCRPLDDDIVAALHQLLVDHGVSVWAFSGTDWFVVDPEGPHVARESAAVQFRPDVVASFDGIKQIVKLVGVSDDEPRLSGAADAVHREFGFAVSATRSQSYYLDITHPEANKGAVVDYAVATLGVPAERIVAVGDMPNDLPMLDKAGLGIAMGNAEPEVQRAAAAVTRRNDDDGFAAAMARFVLEDDAAAGPPHDQNPVLEPRPGPQARSGHREETP
jgi:Cof subfamily protein (haloacid dehalogenase superfamily)